MLFGLNLPVNTTNGILSGELGAKLEACLFHFCTRCQIALTDDCVRAFSVDIAVTIRRLLSLFNLIELSLKHV